MGKKQPKMIDIFDKHGWLDVDKMLKIAGQTNFIFCIGARGIGKSFNVLKWVLDHKKIFMYLRRTKTQYNVCKTDAASPFKALEAEANKGPFVLKSKSADLTAIYTGIPDEEDEDKIIEDDFIGYMANLATFANLRSTSFQDVEVVIYDEFCPEPSERPIRGGDANALFNALETIARNRELLENGKPLLVFCLANANDIGNDIYKSLGFVDKAAEMVETHQSVSVMNDRCCTLFQLDFSPISEAKKHTSLYKLTAGASNQFNEMALENKFYRDTSALIKSRNIKEYNPMCSIGGITIYRSKTADNRSKFKYYVTPYATGTPRKFGSGKAEKQRFIKQYLPIWYSFLANYVCFESYSSYVLFQDAFDITKS